MTRHAQNAFSQQKYSATILVLLLCLTVAWPRAARAEAADGADVVAGKTAFALGSVLCGAATATTPAERHTLHALLLDCPADRKTDGMTQIRQEARRVAAAWPHAEKRRAVSFLIAHPLPVTHLTAVVLTLFSPAPQFAVVPDADVGGLTENWTAQEREALASLLRHAWQEGQLAKTWQHVRPRWQRAQLGSARVAAALSHTRHFLRLPITAPLHVRYVTVDPLLPAGAALSSMFTDSDVGILVGPAETVAQQETLLVHELLHPLLNYFVAHNARAQNSLELANCVFDAVREDARSSFAATKVYTSWDVYFTETAVRALSHRITKTREENDGFVLAHDVAWELDRFEVAHFGFETLWTRALARLEGDFCRSHQASALGVRPSAYLAAHLPATRDAN